jgi:hypothetical protein
MGLPVNGSGAAGGTAAAGLSPLRRIDRQHACAQARQRRLGRVFTRRIADTHRLAIPHGHEPRIDRRWVVRDEPVAVHRVAFTEGQYLPLLRIERERMPVETQRVHAQRLLLGGELQRGCTDRARIALQNDQQIRALLFAICGSLTAPDVIARKGPGLVVVRKRLIGGRGSNCKRQPGEERG